MDKPVKYAQSIQHNTKTLQYVHDFTSLIFGISAGILQLESLNGFLFLFISFALVSSLFTISHCQLQPSRYFESPLKSLYVDDLARYLTAFLMSWTLAYALVQS
ncbi:Emc6p CYBJADRAFT_168606 [Cyberlindnera jadinii NRRL Y-1542]|uniref:ER membrane protein complex subunit 6 n=1 Tax=Cyberlindnera jadinii (strain ATCC 18201 / CBS 1600 / BCRC 20928 / JCM 3617 / NBRC 0987 / NRRL Y-1542) TaxID=983966 RepID=A0A1E4RYI6_CYBJN|nr:hypothetical protein CYBJADRAFT_168606 [Cyberlindnera jadinii NRRL Y-1542]ODV72290.1 hypothetical protein CYBJADRAFT_168606 [Cyberlindnera jadinii NRRL Y-1542]